MKKSARILILFFLFSGLCWLGAQNRSSYFDQPARIILPKDYQSSQIYPAIIFLPYTNGSSMEQARAFGVIPDKQREFIVILPAGRFSSRDYLPDFRQFVAWFEERLLQDLQDAKSRFPIDASRVYLAGYSLGGDLSWALSARNPQTFAGAVMAGTRASYPLSDNSRQILSRTGYRGYFLIGDREHPDRTNGINRAYSSLNNGGVDSRLQTYPGGHNIPPQNFLAHGMEFISGSTEIARAPRPAPKAGSSIPWRSITGSVLLREPSPHFGLRYTPGFSIGSSGFQTPAFHQGQFRAEGLFDDIYLRGIASLSSQMLSTGYAMNSFSQEIALAYGRGTMWGLGFSWDWKRWISNEDLTHMDATETSNVHNAFFVSLFWIHPRRMQGIPASVLEFRYQIPLGIKPFLPAHVFNNELRYHLHVSDRIMLTAGLGSITIQNSSISETVLLEESLDYRLFWEAGIAFRIPGPFRWSVHHTGSRTKPLGSDSTGYRGEWRFGLEYLF